ncbi:SRPBCC family protein [Pendulispora rubella]|uniref:SRPBCC family protein n=1 Tax=Pendulispora rubella TaxID=2741070 RepID=A0ABZ2L8U7_9BACT
MAFIQREIVVHARAETVWDALRDIGAIHTRLAPGFVTDVQLEEGGEARVVTFGSGFSVRELIIDVSDAARRVAWTVVGSPLFTHHSASAQVFPVGPHSCRFVWTADFLPHAMAPSAIATMDQFLAVMKVTLERTERENNSAHPSV